MLSFAASLPVHKFSDAALSRIPLMQYLGYLPGDILSKVEPEFTGFANEATSEKVKEWTLSAEREPPYVKTYNVWGAKHDVDRLVTSDGWKRLREWGAASGYVQDLRNC